MDKILAVLSSNKINSAYFQTTPSFKYEFEKLITDIKAIEAKVTIGEYEIPNQESCVILSEFVDSLYPTHIQELQKIINELFFDTTHNVIDYINLSIEDSSFTSTFGDMKSQMKDVISQICSKEARNVNSVNSVHGDFIKCMMILDILLVYLNKIKQQNNSLFISIIPYEYIFHFFVSYMIYTNNYYSDNYSDTNNLKDLIIKILNNL